MKGRGGMSNIHVHLMSLASKGVERLGFAQCQRQSQENSQAEAEGRTSVISKFKQLLWL